MREKKETTLLRRKGREIEHSRVGPKTLVRGGWVAVVCVTANGGGFVGKMVGLGHLRKRIVGCRGGGRGRSVGGICNLGKNRDKSKSPCQKKCKLKRKPIRKVEKYRGGRGDER